SGVTAPANDSAAPVSTAGGGEDLREDDVGREHVLGEPPRPARGTGVVALDRTERVDGLVERAEEAEAGCRREMLLRSRRLDDARTAAREVTDRPVAHPAGPRLHVRRLRAAELATRALHVGAERLRRACHDARVGEPPAVRREQRAVVRLAGMEIGGELECDRDAAREIENVEEAGTSVAVVGC